jgi:tetratricopeptide (TPR) repeat protein
MLGRGLDPAPEVERAVAAGRRALALDANYAPALGQIALAELALAQYLVESGGDPRPALERAFAALGRARAENPTHGRTHLYLAQGHHLAALHALREGGEPEAAIEAGRRALAEALRHDADCVDCLVEGARLALTDAALARRRGRPPLPPLRRALAEARSAVAAYPYVDAHRELAHACLRLAEALPREAALAAIAEGEGQIDRALRLDPRGARAHAVRGGLSLARARLAREAGPRAEALRGAGADLDRALELDPLLRGELEGPRRELDRLLAHAARAPR